MFTQSNSHTVEYVTASGALGFDGEGWWWEKPLVAAGLMKPELFTIVLRTLTRQPRLYPVSNLSWIRPWTWLPWSRSSCVQFLPNDGVVNKVGLWNPGIETWIKKIAPKIDFKKRKIVVSIHGAKVGLATMAKMLNEYELVAIEINVSCPNTDERSLAIQIIESVLAIKKVSRHPIWLKLSVDQMEAVQEIALRTLGCVAAFSLNSVPYTLAFPDKNPATSPVAKIGKPGSGYGGVSGKPAQEKNWEAVRILVEHGHGIPVIAPSVMKYEDMAKVRELGASAISFGAIHCRTPWKPTAIVQREKDERIASWFSR